MEQNKNKTLWILLVTLLGVLTTIKLAWIYYDANFNPYALSSFCSINNFIDCDGIARTVHSQFFGIPLALWGLFLYSFIILMLFVDKLKNVKFLKFLEVFKNPLDYIASLGLLSFVISIVLLFMSLFEIKKLCVLCAFTYILNLVIALIATDFKNGGFIKSIKQSVLDFIDAIKVKKYLIALIVVAVAGCGVLFYTTKTMAMAPQVKNMRKWGEFVTAKKNKYKVSGNILGSEKPKVVVDIYSDYQCPICYAHNMMMHKLAKDFKNVQIVHHNMPLDMECNRFLTRPFHKGACLDARYEIAAQKQGKAWDMNDLLFQHKPQREEQILELAKALNINLDQLRLDANSRETHIRLRAEIAAAYRKGYQGTPVTEIGNKHYTGIKTYEDFRELLIKEGAK